MAYTLDFSLSLGSSKTGLTMRAQLVDTAGANSGSEVTTGFAEIGQGFYLWHYASIPDGHRGGVKFYESGVPGTILGFAAINPEEGEYLDASVQTVDTNVDAILLDTGTDGVVLANDAITAAKIATDAIGSDELADSAVTKIFAYVAEGALTFVQMLRVMYAVLAGKSSGGATVTIKFRDVADAKDRVSTTVDSNGNRTAISNDGT